MLRPRSVIVVVGTGFGVLAAATMVGMGLAMPVAAGSLCRWMEIAIRRLARTGIALGGWRRDRWRGAAVPHLGVDGGGGTDQDCGSNAVKQHFSEHLITPSMSMPATLAKHT